MEEGMFGKHRPFLLASSDGCSVFQFRTDEGDGTMTCYEVFPGAMLSFNDFHMPYFQSEYVPGKRFLPSTIAGKGGWNIWRRKTPMLILRREI